MPRINRRQSCSMILALLVAFCVHVRAAESRPPAARPAQLQSAELIRVPTSSGPMRFHVSDADARSSRAWRDNADRVEKYKTDAMPTPGYELTNRVIVRTRDPRRLRALTAGGRTIRPLLARRDYWVLSADSVREAVALAENLRDEGGFEEVSVDVKRPWVLRSLPTDPLFPHQWHLRNEAEPLFDVNAEDAWNAGFTGAGVVIGIVENAWQHDHPDLAANFLPEASQLTGSITSHATSCAGIAAAVANNGLMGAGAAHGAWLSDQIFGSDQETADALAFRNDLNDIKSNSWGPPDTSQVYIMPQVIRAAIEEGIASGRGGLGEIFVWAAGNGGGGTDRVDYDPFVASRYTIAVGAIGDQDTRASYNERGASMLVVAQSNGNDRAIPTTASNGGWTWSFGGTSAACPLAAGAVAMMLEANPTLTWRDVQHVLIESARINDPNHADWITNAAGYDVNENYGFGAVDAGAATALALDWTNVPHEITFDSGVIPVDIAIPDADPNGIVVTTDVTENIRIETVELVLNVETTFIGDLQISMTSPSGVESLFATWRSADGRNDYVDHAFTSFRHWGETPAGQWTVSISDRAGGDLAHWVDFKLVFHGTPSCPGDLDNNGVIDLIDIQMLISNFGACEGDPAFDPAADTNNNRCIELGDLAYILSIYGQACE